MNRIFTALLAAGVGFVILCTLGIWQLERLAWKQDLIAAIDAKLARAAVPIETVPLAPEADFTRVTATGSYIPRNSLFLVTTFGGGGGWQVVTPLLLAGNRVLLVDRGAIAAERQKDFGNEEFVSQPQTLTGILRTRRDGQGPFTPPNNPATNTWYWWDVPAMLASLTLPEGATPVAAVLQLVPGPNPVAGQPVPQAPTAKLSNNHLQYALTWFAFAAILAVITTLFVRGQMKNPAA